MPFRIILLSMAQIILIEPNQSLRDLLTLNLVTYSGAEVIPRKNAQDAFDLLNILPGIDLIISSQSAAAGEQTAREIIDYLIEHKSNTPLIITGKTDIDASELEDQLMIIQNEKDWESILAQSLKVLGLDDEILKKKVLPDYLPIPLHYFYAIQSTCCDVFIRLKKSVDQYQYIKRLHQGDHFNTEAIDRYKAQGLTDLYIPKEFQENFTNFVSDQLVEQLHNFSGTEEERIELVGSSFEVAINEIKKMGFTSATVQLTESIIDSMLKTVNKSPEMSSLLHRVINSETGFLYQKGHMTSIVASECLKKLGLDKPELHQKMAYAAFFHDITLIEQEDLARISSYEELEQMNLPEQQWDLVANHALEGSLLVKQYPDAPKNVSELILHHHGSLNGKGYSSTGANNIPRLSKIFLVASDFTTELLNFKERGGTPKPIIKNLFSKYPDEEIAKIIHVLELTLKAKKD